MRRCLGLTAVVLALVLPPASNPASSSGPHCGDVMTRDAVLTEDLVCSGDGLIIPGFADVTLNLNGHSITGSGSGTGIAIDLGRQEDASRSTPGAVTVESGSIRGFDTGLLIQQSFLEDGISQLVLDRLHIRENNHSGVAGAFVRSGPETVLSNSVIADNHGDGVGMAFGRPFRMVNDKVINNGGNGISAFRNSLHALEESVIAYNGEAGVLLDDSVATISGNTFRGNGDTGLLVREETCAFFPLYVVSDNVAVRNGGGGMSMTASCDSTPPPPSGGGNAAHNNDVFQCVVILCAKNRGQARK